VIYGAGGAVGDAVSRAFAREGARVFLTGCNLSKVDAIAKAIMASDKASGMTGTIMNLSMDSLDD
jgi:NADP-dependent 3-hydroxy acid dehydrogenase YdfG